MNTTDYNQFIDTKEGWVDRRIFWEQEIYEQELKQIFAKALAALFLFSSLLIVEPERLRV